MSGLSTTSPIIEKLPVDGGTRSDTTSPWARASNEYIETRVKCVRLPVRIFWTLSLYRLVVLKKYSCFVLQSVGKGSLWRVCPEYRPALLEVLRKTHYCHRTNSNLLNKPVLWVWFAFLWYTAFIRLNIELSDVLCTTSEEQMTRSLGYWYMHIWPSFWTGWRRLIMSRTSWVRLWKFQVSHNWTQLLNLTR